MTKEQVYQTLLSNIEYKEGEWGIVYLDNALFSLKITPRQFAGFLSALEKKDRYQRFDDGENEGIYGMVKLTSK